MSIYINGCRRSHRLALKTAKRWIDEEFVIVDGGLTSCGQPSLKFLWRSMMRADYQLYCTLQHPDSDAEKQRLQVDLQERLYNQAERYYLQALFKLKADNAHIDGATAYINMKVAKMVEHS